MATYTGDTGNNTYNGTVDGDSITGNAGADTLNGAGGDDTVYGGGGNDSITGGDNNDLLYGDFDLSEDVITNGSFGSPLATGWTANNPSGNDAPNIVSGRVAFNTGGETVYGDSIQQTFATVVGQVYSGSFGAREIGNRPGDHTVVVQILDSSGNVIFTQTEVILDGTNRTITFNFTSTTANSTIRFTNTTSTSSDRSDLHLDDISVLGPAEPIGDDTIDGGAGSDTIFAGAGNDSVLGGGGGDTIYGQDGNDSIDGGDDNDRIYAGAGNDNLTGGAGNDTVYGGDGDDSWQVGDIGDDLVYGGAGNDILSGDLGSDTLYGDDGNDAIEGHQGADFIYGGLGDDYLAGADVTGITTPANRTLTPTIGTEDNLSDYLDGGIGNDTLLGNGGRDTLIGGAGNNFLVGGAGADLFVVEGADTITDFDATTGVSNNGNLDNDFVDLTAFYNATTLAAWNLANPGNQYDNALKWLRADQADGILQSAGSLRIQNGGMAVGAALLNSENTAVCFVAGTRLATAKGHRPIEKLRVGDLVETADQGLQAIRWIGQMTVNGMGDLAPILIEAGTLGNRRDIMVSPLHRMLLSGWQVELMFGEDEVLAAAKMLVNGGTIRPVPMAQISYFHVMFDSHQIVYAEGAGTESFHPGEEGFDALGAAAQDEITALFPRLAGGDFASYGPSARRCLRMHEARLMQMGRKLEKT